jgi:DNA-binding GntR family transcriptional regulator
MTLAIFIRNDLRSRIVKGQPMPSALTLAALSEHYGVSFTPVRQALAQLVEDGDLLRQGNGPLSVNADKVGCGEEPEPLAAPPDYERLLSEVVFRAALTGDASFLREEAMAERFNTSRTMIRGVFGKLTTTGLIEHVPRRGWRVVPFREEDMSDWLDVRELLELKALEWAKDRLEPEKLHALIVANSDGRIDNDLHHYFIERSNNRYLREMIRTHGDYFMAIFELAAPAADVVTQVAREHREILEHVLAGRHEAAKQALSAHIRGQQPIVEGLLATLREGGQLSSA